MNRILVQINTKTNEYPNICRWCENEITSSTKENYLLEIQSMLNDNKFIPVYSNIDCTIDSMYLLSVDNIIAIQIIN